MSHLTGRARATYVQNMFTRIAGRYDVMNRLMTFGQDQNWRREVICRAAISPGSQVLDLGAGTGDIAREIHAREPQAWPVAGDFTVEMMRVGQKRPNGDALDWCATDALNLPYAGETFDAVVSGFLMRNVTDLPRALAEQRRILKPGGRIVILDTTRPPDNLLAPFIRIHLNYVIPTLGKLITGESEAYTYLPDTTKSFLRAEELAARMGEAQFQQIGFKRVMFGTIAIHWAQK